MPAQNVPHEDKLAHRRFPRRGCAAGGQAGGGEKLGVLS